MKTPLIVIPTLDEIQRDPARAVTLTADVARQLHGQCVVALAALLPALVGASEATKRSTPTSDGQLLDVDEAARRLGKSPSWLYRNARDLPFTVRVGRSLRFSPEKLARYVADRVGAGA